MCSIYVSNFSTKFRYVSTFSTNLWYVSIFSNKLWFVSTFSNQQKSIRLRSTSSDSTFSTKIRQVSAISVSSTDIFETLYVSKLLYVLSFSTKIGYFLTFSTNILNFSTKNAYNWFSRPMFWLSRPKSGMPRLLRDLKLVLDREISVAKLQLLDFQSWNKNRAPQTGIYRMKCFFFRMFYNAAYKKPTCTV